MYQRRLTIFLLLAAVALLGALLALSLRPSNMFRITPPAQGLAELKAVSATTVSATTLLEKPRYTGQDDTGRNWLLTAESAGQEGTATSGTYVLNQVEATFASPSQTTPFTLSAQEGRYRQTSSTLQLTGDVSATGMGFNLTAPKVDADLQTRKLKATGGSRVTGNTGDWGVNITAPNLNADQNTNKLVLTGGVHATFTPSKSK